MGRRRRLPKWKRPVRRLVDEALTGSLQAFRVLLMLNHLLEDPSTAPAGSELEAADQKVLDMLVRRFSTAPGE